MFGVHIFSECVWVHWEDEELMFNTISCSLKCFQMKIIFKDATDSEFACDLAAAPQLLTFCLVLSVFFGVFFRPRQIGQQQRLGWFFFFFFFACGRKLLCPLS